MNPIIIKCHQCLSYILNSKYTFYCRHCGKKYNDKYAKETEAEEERGLIKNFWAEK